MITYTVNITTPVIDNTVLTVNGVRQPATQVSPATPRDDYGNTSILCLNAEDRVQLTMYGGNTPITLTSGAGATLTMTQIS